MAIFDKNRHTIVRIFDIFGPQKSIFHGVFVKNSDFSYFAHFPCVFEKKREFHKILRIFGVSEIFNFGISKFGSLLDKIPKEMSMRPPISDTI